MRKIFLLILSLLLLIILTSCKKETDKEIDNRETVKIAYLPITHSIPVLIEEAIVNDLNLNYKIELVKFASWPELVDALRLNKVDGASMLFELSLKAAEASKNLKMVSLSHRNGNIIASKIEINSTKDLRGKTIAIPHQLSPHNTLLHMFLEREDMLLSDVNIIELAPAEMPSSLAAKAIDAYLAAEPYGSMSVAVGCGKVLEHSNTINPDSICCVMMFNEEFLNRNKSLSKDVLEKFDQACTLAEKKDDYVIEIFNRHSNLKADVLAQAINLTSYSNLYLEEDEYIKITDSIRKYKILENIPKYQEFVYDRANLN